MMVVAATLSVCIPVLMQRGPRRPKLQALGLGAVALCLTLTGCASAPQPTPLCPPLKTYTLQEQQALAQALGTLPEGSARAAIRGCQGATK